ncbi:Wzz/FepE/Etk N-terminal domain-containing protein [Thalassotalea marina]|uniref:LPS biosynthesis protein n=1 Tax=Thalassotalea marina TaxID=1673741 RepID=A0A919BCA3_9GAMM|nr:Wzz/FepE/Etk N-terminal domain-containing protein [Thalassotalea marina]GHF80968.1 LPS biosynthesis protein [Thalassotalea marina]
MIDFLKDVVRFKWLVITITALFTLGSAILAINTAEEYKAEVMLMPVNEEQASGLGAMAGQLGGIASLAGLNVGGGANEKVALALALIDDWSFADEFIRKHNLKVYLYAVVGWNKASNELIYDDSVFDNQTMTWKMNDGVSEEPSDWLIFNELKERVILRQQKNSPIITASLDYYSPELAAKWLDDLLMAINKKIQANDMQDSKNNIDYLSEKVDSTNISEMRTVFYQLLQEQMKKLMLAEVREEYILKKVGLVKTPESKFKPRRALIVVMGFFCGFMLSLVLLSFRPIFFALKEHRVI